jgi:TonB-dependent receptor
MLSFAPAYAQDAAPSPETDPPADQIQGVGGGQQTEGTVSSSTDPDDATTDNGAIIVTGIRQSLQNSQNIKRNADTVVDAITAQDIGALPDRSVTEALQRVPGVAINRFAGTSDPDHFSVEGSGVVVRGLTYVRSEFNGRDTFSTGVYGQAINFQDVPAELLGSVEVYKNSTADLIEGGLSGTINMNLRLPFDSKGLHIGYDIEANYGDFRKKWSPVGSLLVSNTWDTGMGRIGLLGAFSYSKLYSRSDGVQVSNFQTRDGNFALNANTTDTQNLVCRTPLPGTTDQTGFPPNIDSWQGGSAGNGTGGSALPGPGVLGGPCFGTAAGGPDGFYDFAGTRYAPIGGQFRRQEFDRKRQGIAAAAQWESLDRRALLTAQFLRSKATESWGEYTFEAGSDLSEYNTFPAGCLPNTAGPIGGTYPNQAAQPIARCQVGPNGEILGASGTNWQGYPDGATFPNYQYDSDGVFESGYITLPMGGWRGGSWDHVAQGGMQHTLNTRQVHDENTVRDQSINFKYKPDDHWAINLDAQYVKAKHDNIDFGIHGSTFADQELDLTGKYPVVIPHKPLTLSQTWAAPSAALEGASDAEYFGNPRYTFWRSAMDHMEHSRGHEWAFRGDVAYNFLDDSNFLKQVKFGARYADREQHIKYTTYNWGSLSEVWGSAVFMDQVGGANISPYEWDNFFRGDTAPPPVANYYNGNLTSGYDDAVAFIQTIQAQAASQGFNGSWNPLALRAGVVSGTPFLPSEIQDVSQETTNAYMMLRFGKDEPIFGDVRLDGNIGARWVSDDLSSVGAIGVPSQQALGVDQPYAVTCAPRVPPPGAPPGFPTTPGGVCVLGPQGYAALQQWATGITPPDTARNDNTYWLPSLNLKFGIGRDLIFRLAYSKNLARPSLADIRNFRTFSISSTGQINANSGNPYLESITSNNFDASLEWYFGGNGVGLLTLNGFIKNIHNYIFNNTVAEDITSNGITERVFVRGPQNFTGTGKVRGFEVSYNQVYDFLPGILSGFGLSANYTYLKSSGIPNSYLNGGNPTNQSPIGVAGNLPLAQLSKHNINIQPFYEKGPVSIRVAYNWRSKFLLTESDVIFPYMPIYNDKTGQLDASAFYSIADWLKVGVQATNLTNEVTKTLQQFTLDGKLGPRSYFMNDRRFAFIVRGSFSPKPAVAPPPPVEPPPPAPPPPATQTCADGSVILAADSCPAAPTPPPPPPPAPERG